MQKLKELGDMVYSISSKTYRPPSAKNYGNNTFSPNINSTLDQMKRNF